MKPAARWTLWALGSVLAIASALGLVFALLVPGNDELAARFAAQAEAKLGVKVTIGAAHWRLSPLALVIEQAATVQAEPIVFSRLVIQPDLDALRRGRVTRAHVLVDGGVMPQLSLRALKIQPAPATQEDRGLLIEQLRFRNLTWITRHGIALEFEGSTLFDAGWLPRQVELVRSGVQPLTQFTLAREGADTQWQVRVLLGGGTAHGQIVLQTQGDGTLRLTGQLEPRQVEVASAMAAFKRQSAVRGKATGRTTLSASGKGLAALAQSLQTQFSVASAVLQNIDVDKAIRSVGQDRAGETPLRSLTGTMHTQNTPNGIEVRYSGIQASGETFSASGGGSIINRRINAEVKVDMVGGLIGVPLKVTGLLDAPQVSVAIPASTVAGATAGAVIGTAVLPGVGTAIGAGVAIGKLFKGDEPKKAAR